jgi:hypothetical protein
MTEHPLTDEKALNLFSFERLIDTSEPISIEDAMRTAADWQLEQVMKWLDENLSNYTDDDYLGDCEPLHKLQDYLKKAMRPQEDN